LIIQNKVYLNDKIVLNINLNHPKTFVGLGGGRGALNSKWKKESKYIKVLKARGFF